MHKLLQVIVTRKKALRFLVVSTAVGAVGSWAMSRELDRLTAMSRIAPEEAAVNAMGWFALIMGATLVATIAAALVIARLSVGALRQGEFPPPGMRLWPDARRLTGSAAAGFGVFGLAMSGTLVACAVAIAALVVRLHACMLSKLGG